MTPPLSTERIIFEPFSPRDLPRLIRFHSDPLVQTGYDPHGKPWSAESIAKRLEAYIAEHQIQGFSRWKMSLIDGEFIGRAGLGWFEKGVSVELGFGLLPKYWGRGYATEAADALVRRDGNACRSRELLPLHMWGIFRHAKSLHELA